MKWGIIAMSQKKIETKILHIIIIALVLCFLITGLQLFMKRYVTADSTTVPTTITAIASSELIK